MSFEQNLFAHYEATTIFRRDTNKKLPITLITGPLGSGKTTAVRNIVKNRANLRICVAVNDFAHVNVDQAVLCHGASSSSSTHDCSTTHSNGMSTKRVVDSVVSLHDGCICCSLMGQFRESIAKIIHSDDAFDYAIIETSGVTDPTTVIAALEEQFGKMYRARLDQVVCVIDASLFFIDDPHNSCCNDDNDSHCYTTTTSLSSHGAGTDCCQQREDNGRRHARLDRLTLAQLRSADLIVLNKTDLIDDKQLERAFAYIAEINPMAKVRPTTYAEIPIHELLDVVVAVNHGSSSGVLSHEADRANRKFIASPDGGHLRSLQLARERGDFQMTTPTHNSIAAAADVGGERPHQASDQRAFGCTSAPPFDLARFSDFCHALPSSVLRGKGTVLFRDDNNSKSNGSVAAVVYEFHISGRGRHLDIDFAPNSDARSVQLAFIGTNSDDFDVSRLTAALATCSAPADSVADSAYIAHCLATIRADNRFDAQLNASRDSVLFRVTSRHIGIDERELRAYHGVSLDVVNRALMRAINAVNATTTATSGGGGGWRAPCLVVPTTLANDGGGLWLRASLLARLATFDKLWPIVLEVTARVLSKHFKNIGGCKCHY